jgi:hypothetical protein
MSNLTGSAPVHACRVNLQLKMKTFVVAVLALLLAGCATERYYPVYLPDGDGYYIAEQNYAAGGYGASYDSLFALGVYPWWVHTFYSPYYYPYYFSYYHPFYYPYYGPYHFAGWYPSWPYYAGYQGRHSYGWPPYHSFRYAPPGPPSGGAPPGEPGIGHRGGRADQPVADQPRRRAIGERSLAREAIYGGIAPQRVTAPVSAEHRSRAGEPLAPPAARPGMSVPVDPRPGMPYSGRFPAAPPGQPAAPVGQPVAPAAAGRPFSSEPARIRPPPSERSPAERDQ